MVWDLQVLGLAIFGQPRFSSSMLPCPRLPEHLIQVPDLIDLALPVFFGGRWHILQTSAQINIQENKSHCLVQSSLTCIVRQRLLRELCPLASGAKCPFFGLLLVRPENVFSGPRFLFFFALSAVSEEFGHIFRAPENIYWAGIRAPEKGLAEAILGNPRHKKTRGT